MNNTDNIDIDSFDVDLSNFDVDNLKAVYGYNPCCHNMDMNDNNTNQLTLPNSNNNVSTSSSTQYNPGMNNALFGLFSQSNSSSQFNYDMNNTTSNRTSNRTHIIEDAQPFRFNDIVSNIIKIMGENVPKNKRKTDDNSDENLVLRVQSTKNNDKPKKFKKEK